MPSSNTVHIITLSNTWRTTAKVKKVLLHSEMEKKTAETEHWPFHEAKFV